MMVCNLLVIVTFVYRIVHRGDEIGDEDSTPDASRIEFTTVDLAQLEGLSALTAKSSTWSFRGGSRSKTSTSVTAAAASLIWEEERS